MNKIRLTAGTYVAETDCTLSLFHGDQQTEDREIKAGETFTVPSTVNHFAYFITYHPDFGDAVPRATLITGKFMTIDEIATATREQLAEELAAACEYTEDFQTATMEDLRERVWRVTWDTYKARKQ